MSSISRRRFMQPFSLVAVVVLLATTSGRAQQLVQAGDFEYVGAFRLPGGDDPPLSFAYGGNAMSFNPDGDSVNTDAFPGSLFVTGHDRIAYGGVPDGSQLAELSIPVPVLSPRVADLPTASFLQGFHDVTAGHFTQLEEIPKIGIQYLNHPATGPLVHLCWGQHLQPPDQPSHAWFSADLQSAELQGVWFMGNQNPYSTTGYLFDIPAAWAELHAAGRPLATGRMRDGGQGGMGPTLFAYRPWQADGSPPPTGTRLAETTLLLYENAYESDEIVRAMNGYQHPDEWEGGAWITTPSGRSAVLFSGTKATGNKYWYGYLHPDGAGYPCVDADVTDYLTCRMADGSPCPAADFSGCCDAEAGECVSSRGWWSSRFDAQLILYDPAELAQVAAGELESWQPQPYAALDIDQFLYLDPPVWDELDLGRGEQRRNRIGAAAFDRDHGWLYVLERYADGGKPVVHVWRVNDEATALEADFSFTPTTPEVGQTVQFTDSSSGSVDQWAWDFGDGGTSSARNPGHAFSVAGEFSVTLLISGPAGSDQVSRPVVVSPVGGPTPAEPGDFAMVIAAAAHAPGVADSAWVSDLELHAPGTQTVPASLFFLVAGQDNSHAAARQITVPAGGSLRLADVVATTFGASPASGAILVGADHQLLVSSRTYADTADGSFGQYIPGVPLASAIAGGDQARLIQLTHNERYRCNIGFANLTSAALSVTVMLYRADGSLLAELDYQLPPFAQRQLSGDRIFPAAVADAFAVVSAADASARFVTYASVVDNLSNDPIYVQPFVTRGR